MTVFSSRICPQGIAQVFRKLRLTTAIPIALCAATPALAGLEICNDSDRTQSVAIGFKGEPEWTSEGWWNIEANSCAVVIEGDLKARYYYVRAEADNSPFKGGGYNFCITPEIFTIEGDENCEDRGYERADFVEIDTGSSARNFTYRLTQKDMDIAQDSTGLGLEFCNETADVQAVAIAYQGNDGFVSEGWWNVQPGECAKPLSDPLRLQYYYYRAEVDGGDFNGQGHGFCTDSEAFTIDNSQDCAAQGYVTEEFAEIDTGASAKGHTVVLTSETGGLPNQQGLSFCNETAHEQSVSIGYQGEEGWTSEGWWNIEPNGCTQVLTRLTQRYIYYRAEIEGGTFDGQGYTFCTTPDAYTIVGDENCEARGYDAEDFREIDTGDHTGFIFTLVSGDALNADGSAQPDGPAETPRNDNAVTGTGAGLEVCNQSDDIQSLSFGYEGAEGWTSEGWWVLDPGVCTEPELDGNNHRYIYYRAEVDGGDFNGQGYFFCTTPEAYTIPGDNDCATRGYAREDFVELDTGGTSGIYKLVITAANGGVVPNRGAEGGRLQPEVSGPKDDDGPNRPEAEPSTPSVKAPSYTSD